MKPEEYEYGQVYAGEPFIEPKGIYWKLACCHCGLVHEVKIEDADAVNARITMRENAAATRRLRKADPSFVCQPVKKERKGKSGK